MCNIGTIIRVKIVHFDTGAEDDYLAHMTFFEKNTQKNEKSHKVKILLRINFEPYFIPREPNNHIKVVILRLEWYKSTLSVIHKNVLKFKKLLSYKYTEF